MILIILESDKELSLTKKKPRFCVQAKMFTTNPSSYLRNCTCQKSHIVITWCSPIEQAVPSPLNNQASLDSSPSERSTNRSINISIMVNHALLL